VTDSASRNDSSRNDQPCQRLSDHAFEVCYQQYAEGLRAFLRSKLGNDADADDCFSRVFEKFWSQGSRVQPAARGAWLFVVARREAALHWRKKGRAEAVWEGLVQNHDGSIDDCPPDQRLLHCEQLELLKRAADQLPAEQKEIIRRRFIDNSPFHEIAKDLNVPLGTTLSRMHAAIKKLRKILGEDDLG
jgi:RNA polymerase sigma-70 factor, ECF subfamily